MGLFTLGINVLPMTRQRVEEPGNPEGDSIYPMAYEKGEIYAGKNDLQASGTLIGTGAGVGRLPGLLCGIQTATGLIAGT